MMFDQLSAEIVPSLIKGRHNTNTTNNKTKYIPSGTLRVLAGKKLKLFKINTKLILFNSKVKTKQV
jgi:hypothetical protein